MTNQDDSDFWAAKVLLLLGGVDENLVVEGGQRAADRDRTQLERRQRRRVDADARRIVIDVGVVVGFLGEENVKTPLSHSIMDKQA